MSWLSDLLGDTLWGLGTRATAYSRKLSPRALKEEFARWELPHMPESIRGRCVVCGAIGVTADPAVRCPGTDAQQRARAELAKGDNVLHF